MNIRYQIRNDVKSKKRSIIVIVENGKKVRVSLGISIDKKDWGRGYPVKAARTERTRKFLDNLTDDISEWFRTFTQEQGRYPDKEEIKKKVQQLSMKVKTDDDAQYLLDHYDEFFDEMIREGIKTSTLKKYRTLRRFITEVNDDVRIETMNAEAYGKSLIRYLSEVREIENKSANKYIKNFKRFLNWCFEQRRIKEKIADHIPLLPQQDQEIIALEPEEIRTLEHATDLSYKLEKVRDLFLFGIYTGLRYSDIQNVKPINIEKAEDGYRIHIVTQKDNEPQYNPIQEEAVEILKKYEYQLPQYSNQNFNIYIKEFFTLLDLTRPIHFVYLFGRKKTTDVIPLDKCVASHIARKSFVTDLLRRGASPEVVRELSGHKDIRAFQRYIRFSQQDKRNALQLPRE